MSPLAIALTALGYSVVACLMTALWMRIPPQTPFWDAFTGVFWPLALPIMVVSAFIEAAFRATTNQDGVFAGIAKDTKWVRDHKRNASPNLPPPRAYRDD